jgi:DNA (cytosine-5)-methyltransferase 1
MKVIRVGGMFSGIGAHHSALERIMAERDDVRFDVIFQCEFEPKTAKAYDVIHGKTLNLGDVTTVHDIGGDLAVDILYWTPPCQDISLAGKLAGNKEGSGTRSSLAYEVPRILANTSERERPKYLVFEEVPMMISSKFIDSFKDILARLTALDYQHTYGIMNAADYGVAQSRKRCFMISKLGGMAPALPKPIPLTKCMRDYLEPEPVAPHYYLSEDRIKGLIWSNAKEKAAGRGYNFEPRERESVAFTISTKGGGRKTDNFLRCD